MQELTKEQADFLNAKLIIADLSLQLYVLRAESFAREQKQQEEHFALRQELNEFTKDNDVGSER